MLQVRESGGSVYMRYPFKPRFFVIFLVLGGGCRLGLELVGLLREEGLRPVTTSFLFLFLSSFLSLSGVLFLMIVPRFPEISTIGSIGLCAPRSFFQVLRPSRNYSSRCDQTKGNLLELGDDVAGRVRRISPGFYSIILCQVL